MEVKRVDAASVEPRATEANVRFELGERREPPAEHVGAACELEGVQRRVRERVLHLEPVGRDVSDETAVGEQKHRAAVEPPVQSLVPAVVAAAVDRLAVHAEHADDKAVAEQPVRRTRCHLVRRRRPLQPRCLQAERGRAEGDDDGSGDERGAHVPTVERRPARTCRRSPSLTAA